MKRGRRLLFENLETRLPRAGGLSVFVEAQGQQLGGAIEPQFSVDSELSIDIRVLNESQRSYDSAEVKLELGDGLQTTASPRMVQVVPVNARQATFSMGALRFLAHPDQPFVFATIPSTNSLAIFNSKTLQLEANFFIGSRPYGLALSNDGNTLYIANSTSNYIAVVDWKARRVTSRLHISQVPYDIEVGKDGRLFVLANQSLMQIDPRTGREVGPRFPCSVYSGELAISRNQDRLYYGDFGLSPASLYQFDITTNTPKLLWESDHGETSGSNGQAVAMSADGSFVSYAAGYGQLGYRIAKYNTTNMAIDGTFDTGPYPREITYSPDGKTAFAMHSPEEIDVFDTTTFLRKSSIRTNFESNIPQWDTIVDATGQKIFASDGREIAVFETVQELRFVNAGDSNQNGKIDPGEAWVFSATTQASPAKQTIRTFGSVQTQEGLGISAHALGTYIGIASPSFSAGFTKIQGVNPVILSGEPIQYTFSVVNTKSVSFGEVLVSMNNGTPNDRSDDSVARLVSGDTDRNGLLSPGETWVLTVTGGARRGGIQVETSLTADLTDRSGNKLFGQIPANQIVHLTYFGAAPETKISLLVDGTDVSTTEMLFAEAGREMVTKVSATNTGNVALTNVRIEDYSSSDDPLVFEQVSGSSTQRGDLLKTIPELGGRVEFLADTSRNLVYVSVFEKKFVAVLDLDTLRIIDRIAVGAGPTQMALSRDSQTLYVASSAAQQISRIDLRSRTMLSPFVFDKWIVDVEVGSDRLYVLTIDTLFAIHQNTGQPMGPAVSRFQSSEMVISPDLSSLFVSNYGSPASLSKYTLHGDQISFVESRSDDASNAQNLAVSRNGKFVALAAGAGQNGYKIAQYNTADMRIVGSFDTGPYPREIVYGMDDRVAFTVADTPHNPPRIQAWDTTSFSPLFSINTPLVTNKVIVSSDSQVLVASFDDSLRIYDLDKRLRYNIGDSDRNEQLDVGETWQFIDRSSVKPGVHTHTTTVSSTYEKLGVQNLSSIRWDYHGVEGAAIVSENVKGARVQSLPQNPSAIHDQRLVYRDGSIYLKDEASLRHSRDSLQFRVTFADQSQMVMSIYVRSNSSPWHNTIMSSDVDQDAAVTPLDVLLLINELNASGGRRLGVRQESDSTLFDVDADGSLSPLDVLFVINEINRRGQGSGEGEGESASRRDFWLDCEAVDPAKRRTKSSAYPR